MSWSEPQVDREEEAATRREGSHVDVPHDRLVGKVADLWIESAIRGDPKEVASRQREPRVPDGPAKQARRQRLGEVVREVHLSQLEVRSVLDIGFAEACSKTIDPLRPTTCCGVVLAVCRNVVQEFRQIDDVASILPIKQKSQSKPVEVDVVRERHLEVGICISHFPGYRIPRCISPNQTKDLSG